MTELTGLQTSLSSSEQQRFSFLQSQPETKTIRVIQLADPLASQQDGKMDFILPGLADTIRIEANFIKYTSSDEYCWGGKLRDKIGSFSFVKHDGGIMGLLQIDTAFFEIQPLISGQSILIEKRKSPAYTCITSNASGGTGDPTVCETEEEYNTCPATISVLLLISIDARQWLISHYGSKWYPLYLSTGYIDANLAFFNSDIPNKGIRIMVEPENFDIPYDNNRIIEFDINSLKDLAESKRDSYHADAVILLTNRGYAFQVGMYNLPLHGHARVGPDYLNAFGIVEVPDFNTNYEFSHELGHIMGGRHNFPPVGTDNTEGCNHAWTQTMAIGGNNFKDYTSIIGQDLNTLLTSEVHTNTFILNYSNPNVLSVAGPTGTQYAYNARRIRNAACTVSTFEDTPELEIGIEPIQPLCNRQYKALVKSPPPNSNYGQPPYYYQWRWNLTGIFSPPGQMGIYLGSGATVDLTNLPCKYFLLLIVTSSNGVITSLVTKMDFTGKCTDCPIQSPPPGPGDRSNLVDSKSIRPEIYPNPVSKGILNLFLPSLQYGEQIEVLFKKVC